MIRLITTLALAVSLSGCINGFVNKERIKDPVTQKDELYTYITRIDQLLDVYAVDETTKADFKLVLDELEKLKGESSASFENTKAAQLLAEKLDQINSQNYPILFSIVVGLNSNPSSKDNQKSFWNTLNNLIDKTHATRQEQLNVELTRLKVELLELKNKPNPGA